MFCISGMLPFIQTVHLHCLIFVFTAIFTCLLFYLFASTLTSMTSIRQISISKRANEVGARSSNISVYHLAGTTQKQGRLTWTKDDDDEDEEEDTVVSHRACASNGYPLTPPQGAVQLRFASLWRFVELSCVSLYITETVSQRQRPKTQLYTLTGDRRGRRASYHDHPWRGCTVSWVCVQWCCPQQC